MRPASGDSSRRTGEALSGDRNLSSSSTPPPGRVTRAASRRQATLSGTTATIRCSTTQSKLSSANGKAHRVTADRLIIKPVGTRQAARQHRAVVVQAGVAMPRREQWQIEAGADAAEQHIGGRFRQRTQTGTARAARGDVDQPVVEGGDAGV
jgi:hypothetical protein